MKSLSDPARVKIIKMLQHKLMSVCELQEALHISQSSV
jgi:ArsR family transcriptional regulator